jgi:ubiquinone/menaquinone biosynthesis C-methylase UbiE
MVRTMVANRGLNRGNFRLPDLAELYARPYDEQAIGWRATSAIEKTDNLTAITSGTRGEIARVLEVGCGTGAMLRNLAAHGLGVEHVGIEITDQRVGMAQEQSAGGISISAYDGKHIPFDDGSFDLVYATHVLEHVTDERGFLRELRRVTRKFVYIEVPCELNLRTTSRRLQRTLDIGHINPYSPDSFALTLETSGLKILRLRAFDHNFETHAFFVPHWRAALKMAIRRLALAASPRGASQVFVYDWGALCEMAPLLSIS